MQKSEWIFAGALVVLVVGLGSFFLYAPQTPPSNIANGPVDVGGGAMIIEEQTALNVVHVAATLTAPGFITIHESFGGAPGTIIGTSAYLPAGDYPDIRIEATMLPSYQYIGLLHADNGDSVFVVEDDMPVKTNDEVVKVKFVTAEDAK